MLSGQYSTQLSSLYGKELEKKEIEEQRQKGKCLGQASFVEAKKNEIRLHTRAKSKTRTVLPDNGVE